MLYSFFLKTVPSRQQKSNPLLCQYRTSRPPLYRLLADCSAERVRSKGPERILMKDALQRNLALLFETPLPCSTLLCRKGCYLAFSIFFHIWNKAALVFLTPLHDKESYPQTTRGCRPPHTTPGIKILKRPAPITQNPVPVVTPRPFFSLLNFPLN